MLDSQRRAPFEAVRVHRGGRANWWAQNRPPAINDKMPILPSLPPQSCVQVAELKRSTYAVAGLQLVPAASRNALERAV